MGKDMTAETGNFDILKQRSFFDIGPKPYGTNPLFSIELLKTLSEGEMTKLELERKQLFQLLGVSSVPEITNLLNDPIKRAETSTRFTHELGGSFGIEGSTKEREERITRYAEEADRVILYLGTSVLPDFNSNIEMVNEVKTANNPLDLLLITFDKKYNKQARFEAKRKLVLMRVAGSIDQAEREMGVSDQFRQFQEFLNNHVWNTDLLIGDSTKAHLVSTHNPETFRCESVNILNEVPQEKLQPNQKLTTLPRRSFQFEGNTIPIYVTARKKEAEAKILKLLRKRGANPLVAVEDGVGLMAVLNTEKDIGRFEKHLLNCASEAGSPMRLEEVHDSLKSGGGTNDQSSKELKMRRYFIKMGKIRVELMLFTNSAYLDYKYQSGVSHQEYEVRRLFDSGAIGLLYPQDLYKLDYNAMQTKSIARVRGQIETQ
jgi:hypothetical protein